MPETVSTMLGAILDLTDDAILVIDPSSRTIQFSSPRAIEIIGRTLASDNVPLSHIFANDEAEFDQFLQRSKSVTDPIISQVSILPGKNVMTAKGRRMTASDGTPKVLLLLEREAELAHRFRLISDRITGLRTEVGRRVLAERKLSSNMTALRRALDAIRKMASVDVSSAGYLDQTVALIADTLEVDAVMLVMDTLGQLHVSAAAGRFADHGLHDRFLEVSRVDFARHWADDPQRAKALLLAAIRQVSGHAINATDTMTVPITVTGVTRGALICTTEPGSVRGMATQAEGDIVAEVLGNLIARAETEARLIHAQKLHAVGQLTGGIAHDFNNILAVVLGNAEILLDELKSNERELAEDIVDAARRGATLTARLLAFARKQPLKPEATDVNVLLREIEPLLRRTVRENIELSLINGGNLWSGRVDKSQFENAVLNLVANARDAMPTGGKLTIETANVRLDENYAAQHDEVTAGHYVMVAVSDSGTGMSPEVAKEAFTPFFTTKTVGDGSGLGLSMVFGFVKQSEGHVKIYSEVGIGTTIKMYFPSAYTDGSDTSAQLSDDVDSEAQRRGKILLTEDDAGVLRFITRSLTRLGYEVEAVSNAEDAAALLRRHSYDLLLTDVVLPGVMNGAELAEIAKSLAPDMPVLFMSGYTENVIVHNGRLDPDVEFISKPFTREQLASRLAALIGYQP
ncbi:response regulator [Arenibacterium halophilum]|uniref:histidine kinase n=1 Tax=Arenibacterium halophilum TaxID=2583821 RepID=A0ABY2XBN4_9RHOB|nr:response regulator [Arenibacterium halophilum]TMV13374.1 response regulator [Arenibacterium halophilum]